MPEIVGIPFKDHDNAELKILQRQPAGSSDVFNARGQN